MSAAQNPCSSLVGDLVAREVRQRAAVVAAHEQRVLAPGRAGGEDRLHRHARALGVQGEEGLVLDLRLASDRGRGGAVLVEQARPGRGDQRALERVASVDADEDAAAGVVGAGGVHDTARVGRCVLELADAHAEVLELVDHELERHVAARRPERDVDGGRRSDTQDDAGEAPTSRSISSATPATVPNDTSSQPRRR